MSDSKRNDTTFPSVFKAIQEEKKRTLLEICEDVSAKNNNPTGRKPGFKRIRGTCTIYYMTILNECY